MAHADLYAMFGREQHRIARDFGAGSGRGRYGDAGGWIDVEGDAFPDDFEVIH